jgi:hypothetical protein
MIMFGMGINMDSVAVQAWPHSPQFKFAPSSIFFSCAWYVFCAMNMERFAGNKAAVILKGYWHFKI